MGAAHDLLRLLSQFRKGGGVGEDEAREVEETLVLVKDVVERLLVLRLRLGEFRREDAVVVALPQGSPLIVDNLLLNPGGLPLHERDGLGPVDWTKVPGYGHGRHPA